MLGPIFNREALTIPRRGRHYLNRAAYLGILWVLGLTLLTPVIALAGLLALIGVTVAGMIRLVRTTVPQTGRTRLTHCRGAGVQVPARIVTRHCPVGA